MMSIGAPEMTACGVAADFTAFFEAEYERLFQTLYLMCGNKADAEDLAQETMARAFERWDRVQAAETPTAYVFQIAFNLRRSLLRRAGRALGSGNRVPASDEPNIGQARLEVLEALSALPRSQREALLLMEWLGFSAAEAGRILGIEASSVRGRVHRARAALRERFGGTDA
jgi:RNA polymerase sigma-70 factor (ECF subfamily)